MPTKRRKANHKGSSLTVAGLFAGIGGVERGLHRAGHSTEILCEILPSAQRVLEKRFPQTQLARDIRALRSLPEVDLVAAGFPCQDLSQAGRTAGIAGSESSLIGEVFRLIGRKCRASPSPKWLLIENVPFMLQLDRGRAMRYLVTELEQRGFMWAYRVVDTRAFGLPQRRRRVLLLASRTEDPRGILLNSDAGDRQSERTGGVAFGFYWTEGLRGLGWAVDSIPTLKGGSTVGIPSPPAIWIAQERTVVTPHIRDAERLQGFPQDWTLPAVNGDKTKRNGPRWRLVGNAVSVPVAHWIGLRLSNPEDYDPCTEIPLSVGSRWPVAAWGRAGKAFQVERSAWPVSRKTIRLLDFLRSPTLPLSARATAGFLQRLRQSSLKYPSQFERDLQHHLKRMQKERTVD